MIPYSRQISRYLRMLGWAVLALLLAALPLWEEPAAAEEDQAEWTVMLYLCGSDLESRHAMATYNLREIANIRLPEYTMASTEDGPAMQPWQPGGVNLVFETGGSKQWHGMEPDETGNSLELDISTQALQRYETHLELLPNGYAPRFSLVDTQPLACMSEPDTLSDFIQWAAREYPAKRYMLVLWDHGGGSRTGLYVDELFDNAIMPLYKLGPALESGGVHFDALAIDACLMASIETACVVAPYADYLIASEEVTSGYGSAFADWMFELYRSPSMLGDQLGVEFCDSTLRKYSNIDEAVSEAQLTWSVTELSYIDELCRSFDEMFDFVCQLYEQRPDKFNTFGNIIMNSESYGQSDEDMVDLGSFLNDKATLTLLDNALRNHLKSTLNDAVLYDVSGSGRINSLGLSFCYAPEMSAEELNDYARICPSPHYLALLDAVNPDWDAPDGIFDKARHLTPIEEIPEYQMQLELLPQEGLPKLFIHDDSTSFRSCAINLYWENYEGSISLLGQYEAMLDWDEERGKLYYTMDPYRVWPSVDGEPLSLTLLSIQDNVYLYNVPVKLGTEIRNMRVSCTIYNDPQTGDTGFDYKALGVWQGFDQDTRMPGRAVTALSQLQGQEFHFVYPTYADGNADTIAYYDESPLLTMYRYLDIERIPLPAGDYWVSFTVDDVFRRKVETQRIPLHWDGEQILPRG